MSLFAALSLLLLADPAGWEPVSQGGGVTVTRRAVKGSDFYEYRAEAVTKAGVEALCEKVFQWATVGTDHPGLKLRQLLEDGRDERRVYDQIESPLVSNRDYVMRVRRTREASSCHIRFDADGDGTGAPKAPDGFVRLTRLRGAWDFEPTAGGTQVTYSIFAEPAGSVPAFLVNGSQKDRTAEVLRQGMAKARAP